MILLLILAYLPLPSSAGQDVIGECTLNVAAVSTSGEGVLGKLDVKVVKGSGRVYISTSPATEVDVQGAARMAAFVSTLLLGLDYSSYDYYYTLEAPSIIVGGPSAGAAMALATIAALNGLDCNTRNVITGMVYLDSTIGPVGGLKKKLEAVASGGGKLFIVPQGQLVYTSYERMAENIGPLVVIKTVPVKVNLSEEGARLGVTVKEAGSILEAAPMLLGLNITLNTSAKPVKATGLDRVYNMLHKEYEEMVSQAPSNSEYRNIADKAKEYAAEAEKEASRGRYFVATRLMVDALAMAQTSLWLKYAIDHDLNATPMINEAGEAVNRSLKAIEGTGTEAGGLASIYLWIAASHLNNARKAIGDDGELPYTITITGAAVDPTPLTQLAYAKWMARMAEELAALGWDKIGDAVEKAKVASSLGRSVVAYATALTQEAGITSATVDIAAEMIVSATSEKNSVVATYLSLSSAALATASIHTAFDGDTRLRYAEKLAYYLASSSGSKAASALLEAYKYYASRGDTERAWSYLDLAILASWAVLNTGGGASASTTTPEQGQGSTVAPTTTVTEALTVTRETPQTPIGTVTVGLLAGMALGFIVGVALVYRRH